MGEHDRRIARQPAPMAGMHAARAQLQHQVEMEGAARAGGDGGHGGFHARAVRGDQHVGGQFLRMGGDEIAQALRAALLGHLHHDLDVEAELAAALRQHGLQRGDVERVLALVVGGAAAVPAVALLGQRPGLQAGAPLVVEPAHRVAMAIEQHGRARRDPRCGCRSGSGRSPRAGSGGSRTAKPSRSSQGRIAPCR